MTNDQQEKLESVRRRIKILREALEDPTMLTELTIDGVSERFDRAQARAELKELEEEEARLSGRKQRAFGVRFH